jgi:dihydrofolate reductase
VARLVFGMNMSLDGFVDHDPPDMRPDPALFRHFVAEAQAQSGALYGREVYELMRYWDEDRPEWGADEAAFAAAWRRQPKWVVTATLASLGPNAVRVTGDLEAAVRALKATRDGEIGVAGPQLAASLGRMGLIDEYRIWLHPAVLGGGLRYFADSLPPLRLIAHEPVAAGILKLRYAPAAAR